MVCEHIFFCRSVFTIWSNAFGSHNKVCKRLSVTNGDPMEANIEGWERSARKHGTTPHPPITMSFPCASCVFVPAYRFAICHAEQVGFGRVTPMRMESCTYVADPLPCVSKMYMLTVSLATPLAQLLFASAFGHTHKHVCVTWGSWPHTQSLCSRLACRAAQTLDLLAHGARLPSFAWFGGVAGFYEYTGCVDYA